jgi:hypothetical protein
MSNAIGSGSAPYFTAWTIRGELAIRRVRATTLHAVDPTWMPTMMQPCASAAKLRGGRPNLPKRYEVHGSPRVTTTSDRQSDVVRKQTYADFGDFATLSSFPQS